MAKKSIGKAYVQIVPSAAGIKGAITNLLSNESSSAGIKSGSIIGSSIKKMIMSAGIGTTIASALTEGANLQQSIGGIETLFKKSADKMKEYALQAYKTAGVSANSYMEQATSFSASLLQSVGGDTEKAAKAANQAIIDMADNSNKMGTSLENIQNAYQGFAKQNYTMLDNLKLGYGGTKTEMERLLSDAQRLTGIKYDISNLNDVYSAIHVIQGELGITGTTALEASKTLLGSFSSMKASLQNFLGSLTLGENIKPSLKALVETTSTFLIDNLLPSIWNITKAIPDVMMTVLPDIIRRGKEMIQSLIVGIKDKLPQILEVGTVSLTTFIEGIWDNLPSLLSTAGDLVVNLVSAIVERLPQILDCSYRIVASFVAGFIRNLPQILQTGVTLIGNLATGLLNGIPDLINRVVYIFNNIKEKFKSLDWVGIGINIIKGIINGISSAVGGLIDAAKNAASSALRGMKNLLGIHSPSKVFDTEVGKMISLGLAQGIENNLNPVKDAMKTLNNETMGMVGGNFTVSQRSEQNYMDYGKFAEILADVLKHLKIELDQEEVGRLIDSRLLEVI